MWKCDLEDVVRFEQCRPFALQRYMVVQGWMRLSGRYGMAAKKVGVEVRTVAVTETMVHLR